MRTSIAFVPADPRALAHFVRTYPLAQVVSWSEDRAEATPLPLVTEVDERGTIRAFIGHFSRANPHMELLKRNARALCIFTGAHGYISPAWMRDRTQAPTWNFQTAHFVVDITLSDQESETATAIEQLLDVVEGTHAERWRSQELGERYTRLLRAVIGFRATVVEARVKFKLGQNERDDVYEDILLGLQRTGNTPLAEAMETLNRRCPHLLRKSD